MSTRTALALLTCLCLTGGCSKKEEKLASLPFSDDFERSELGPDWAGDPAWRIRDGQVFSTGTRNRALWLQARLPDDAVIEFDARSESPDGDIKFEMYADGHSHASGYILIFGGWKNSISVVARLDEHGADRQELPKRGVVKTGQTYRMKVVRKDKVIRWYVDGKLFMDYYDSDPLKGDDNDRFAFNNWEAHLFFDKVRIRAATAEDK